MISYATIEGLHQIPAIIHNEEFVYHFTFYESNYNV